MKIKFIILIILISFFLNKKTFASEVEFDASKIDVKNNGNLILGYDSNTIIKSKRGNSITNNISCIVHIISNLSRSFNLHITRIWV